MKSDTYELGRIFNSTFIQVMKDSNNDIDQFIKVFNRRIDKRMDEREEDLRTLIEQIINESRLMMEEWKKIMSERMKGIKSVDTI